MQTRRGRVRAAFGGARQGPSGALGAYTGPAESENGFHIRTRVSQSGSPVLPLPHHSNRQAASSACGPQRWLSPLRLPSRELAHLSSLSSSIASHPWHTVRATRVRILVFCCCRVIISWGPFRTFLIAMRALQSRSPCLCERLRARSTFVLLPMAHMSQATL